MALSIVVDAERLVDHRVVLAHLAGGDAYEPLHETLMHNDVARIRATPQPRV